MNSRKSNYNRGDVVVVGAGPAGIGTAAALRYMGVDRIAIVDRFDIGASFNHWPAEMRLITPSFPAHGFGLLDLNAILPATSPGLMLKSEHPSGPEYATYLRAVIKHIGVASIIGMDVTSVEPIDEGGFKLHSARGTLTSRFVVWAAGEYQYPREVGFPGMRHCIHTSRINAFHELQGDNFTIIGGYESGIDAALTLAKQGKHVRVLDEHSPWNTDDPDPSKSLSTYTIGRLRDALEGGSIKLIGNVRVEAVEYRRGEFEVIADRRQRWTCDHPPILANGFISSLTRVSDLFDWEQNGFAALSHLDESTKTPGLFLAGPKVSHGNQVFCFIYKFRQRYPVMAAEIARRLGHNVDEAVAAYRQAGMYLDDPTCCKNECAC